MHHSDQQLIIIGYAGHAYVILDALNETARTVVGYCEHELKASNPFALDFLGPESGAKARELLVHTPYFVGVGDNLLREKISIQQDEKGGVAGLPVIHPSAIVSTFSNIDRGTFVGPRAVINAFAQIGRGAVVNTGAIIEHECSIGNFAHVAPGAVLLGNVSVGERSLIGGNAVALPGIQIGADCIVGAGAVVRENVPDGATVVGNPARQL
jgi:acetyltransferase EpsM